MDGVESTQIVADVQGAGFQNRTEAGSFILAGIDKGISTEQMQQLYELYVKEKQRLAAIDYHNAFAKFQGACPRIPTSGRNEQFMVTKNGTQQPSQYATLTDITETVRQPLAENNISFSWSDAIVKEKEDGKQTLTLECIIAHSGGHETRHAIELPVAEHAGSEKSKTSPQQGIGVIIAYAQRYSLKNGLALGCDPDYDGNAPTMETSNPISATEIKRIMDLIESKNIDENRVVSWINKKWGVHTFADLSMTNYPEVIHELEKRKVETSNG